MNPKIKFFSLRVANRICKLLHVTKYYETKYGIKVLNRKHEPGPSTNMNNDVVEYSADQLFLGVDGLIDQYSSVGKCIKESPHFDLVFHSKNGYFEKSDYLKRERLGTLDGRDCVYYTPEFHENAYLKAKASIEGQYKPVTLYTINGIHYIADGKHRAALLALEGKLIQCVEVRLSPATLIYMKRLYDIMKNSHDKYSKNIRLISSVFQEYKEELE